MNRAYPKLSVAKVILAALWQIKQGTVSQLVRHRYIREHTQNRSKVTMRSSLTNLTNRGIVERLARGVVALTREGQMHSLRAFTEVEACSVEKGEQKWDGGWRIISLDIPADQRAQKNHIESVLRRVGFHEFQKRLWVYPFPVPRFLKDSLKSEPFKSQAKFILAQAIDNDDQLKNYFKITR